MVVLFRPLFELFRQQRPKTICTNFLVIIGHPNQLIDYYRALADAYIKGASANTVELKTISIAVLTFSPNLAFGYEKRVELEPDLLDAWDKIM